MMPTVYDILGIHEPTPQRIADAARRRRIGHDLTQAELAQSADLPLSVIEQFEETGDISLPALLSIASALDVIYEFADLFPRPLPKSLDEVDGGPR